MTKDEAIALLARCKPISKKLGAQGVNIELDEQDRVALSGFNKVRQAGWLEDEYIHRLAGLLRSDVLALSFAATHN